MTVVDKPIRIISISPAAYDSPYSPAITASAEETGYENLESLNGQTAAVPIQSSSASAGSDDNQYNYDESSTDDLKLATSQSQRMSILSSCVQSLNQSVKW
uniref:Uncharacterized protein n=1 Tax=Ditylenchus dipsaci TaxID=166011 RepID=A0A915CU69_9BILA